MGEKSPIDKRQDLSSSPGYVDLDPLCPRACLALAGEVTSLRLDLVRLHPSWRYGHEWT